MIPVKVDQIFLSNMGFVVLLKGPEDERSLPIFIGAAEAQAIAIQINGIQMPRPLTHDLVKNLLDFLECRLMKIEISDLKNDTFYANLVFEKDGSEMRLDSRPSDAIALALRCAAPVYVAPEVMEKAGRVFEKENDAAGEKDEQVEDKNADHDENLSPLDALKQRLEQAVRDERYEDAARIRDEIKRIENSHSDN